MPTPNTPVPSWKQYAQKLLAACITLLPVLLLIIGAALLLWGYYLDENEYPRLQKLLYSVASAVLSGGVFAAVLKTFQFVGIFQEEIKKILFLDAQWLATLPFEELHRIWRNVIAATVTKGFPQLSQKLGDAVIGELIPEAENFYYAKMYRRIEIESYDSATDLIVMSEEYELHIEARSVDTPVQYTFGLSGDWPAKLGTRPFEVTSLMIDGQQRLAEVAYEGAQGNPAAVKYSIPLTGRNSYRVFREMKRTHLLAGDPILQGVTTRYTESMVLAVKNRVDASIAVKLVPISIDEDTIKTEISSPAPGETRYQWEVNRLIFPRQGLILVFVKK